MPECICLMLVCDSDVNVNESLALHHFLLLYIYSLWRALVFYFLSIFAAECVFLTHFSGWNIIQTFLFCSILSRPVLRQVPSCVI